MCLIEEKVEQRLSTHIPKVLRAFRNGRWVQLPDADQRTGNETTLCLAWARGRVRLVGLCHLHLDVPVANVLRRDLTVADAMPHLVGNVSVRDDAESAIVPHCVDGTKYKKAIDQPDPRTTALHYQ